MSVIGLMMKFDPLPIPFQSVPIKSVPIETESEKSGPDWSASAWPDADIWTPSLKKFRANVSPVHPKNVTFCFPFCVGCANCFPVRFKNLSMRSILFSCWPYWNALRKLSSVRQNTCEPFLFLFHPNQHLFVKSSSCEPIEHLSEIWEGRGLRMTVFWGLLIVNEPF